MIFRPGLLSEALSVTSLRVVCRLQAAYEMRFTAHKVGKISQPGGLVKFTSQIQVKNGTLVFCTWLVPFLSNSPSLPKRGWYEHTTNAHFDCL